MRLEAWIIILVLVAIEVLVSVVLRGPVAWIASGAVGFLIGYLLARSLEGR